MIVVEGRKRTFPLTGPYIPVPYTSADSEKPNEMSRNSATSGTKTTQMSNFCFLQYWMWAWHFNDQLSLPQRSTRAFKSDFLINFLNVSWKTITPVFFSGLAPHHLLSLQSHSASMQGQSMTSPRDEGLLLMQSTNQNTPEQPHHPGLKRGRWESGGSESPIESGKDRDVVHIFPLH